MRDPVSNCVSGDGDNVPNTDSRNEESDHHYDWRNNLDSSNTDSDKKGNSSVTGEKKNEKKEKNTLEKKACVIS